MMPITMRLNRDLRGRPLPTRRLTPETMNDAGADALRMAVIERALWDLKTGIIVTRILTTEKLNMACSAAVKNRLYNYRHTALREMKSARAFLASPWCDTLGMGTDINYLVGETIFNSHKCGMILQQPYTVYTVKNRDITPFLVLKECMDATLLGITNIMPPSLLSHIRTDPNTDVRTILFTQKAKGQPRVKYFGIERSAFGHDQDPDVNALYKRRVAIENNMLYSGRPKDDEEL